MLLRISSHSAAMIYALAVATTLAATTSSATASAASHAIRGSLVSNGDAPGSHTVRASVRSADGSAKKRITDHLKETRFSGGVDAFVAKAKANANLKSKTSSAAGTASHSVSAMEYSTGTAQELIYASSDTSCKSSPAILTSTCHNSAMYILALSEP